MSAPGAGCPGSEGSACHEEKATGLAQILPRRGQPGQAPYPTPRPPPRSLRSPSRPLSPLCSRPLRRLQLHKVQPAAHLPRRIRCRQPPHTPGPEAQEEPQPGQQVGNSASSPRALRGLGVRSGLKAFGSTRPPGPPHPVWELLTTALGIAGWCPLLRLARGREELWGLHSAVQYW